MSKIIMEDSASCSDAELRLFSSTRDSLLGIIAWIQSKQSDLIIKRPLANNSQPNWLLV